MNAVPVSTCVYLAPNTTEPFTTSAIIAGHTGVTHRKVRELIGRYRADLESFGKLPRYRGGSGNEADYPLNEPQATFLLTLMKNTPVVVAFKRELVRQFYTMRQELTCINAAKTERKPIRKNMTDAIKALPDSPHKNMKYGQYTDLAYKLALGSTARQLRKERGADKAAVASNFMLASEIEAVADMENKIAVLIEVGMSYQAVKSALSAVRLTRIAAHQKTA